MHGSLKQQNTDHGQQNLDRAKAATPPSARLLRAESISYAFGKNPPVFSDISLTLGRGERIALLGPSGCGKSTLLRLLGGIIQPSTGSITLEHEDDKKTDIGFMFQSPVLLPWRSVKDNIALAASLSKQDSSDTTIQQWCREVGLEGLETRSPIELSGGQRQRAALARALATTPDILLLDEPFSALDKELRERLLLLVDRLTRLHDIAVVLVTHDASEATRLANRRFDFLDTGQLQESDWWLSESI